MSMDMITHLGRCVFPYISWFRRYSNKPYRDPLSGLRLLYLCAAYSPTDTKVESDRSALVFERLCRALVDPK